MRITFFTIYIVLPTNIKMSRRRSSFSENFQLLVQATQHRRMRSCILDDPHIAQNTQIHLPQPLSGFPTKHDIHYTYASSLTNRQQTVWCANTIFSYTNFGFSVQYTMSQPNSSHLATTLLLPSCTLPYSSTAGELWPPIYSNLHTSGHMFDTLNIV